MLERNSGMALAVAVPVAGGESSFGVYVKLQTLDLSRKFLKLKNERTKTVQNDCY